MMIVTSWFSFSLTFFIIVSISIWNVLTEEKKQLLHFETAAVQQSKQLQSYVQHVMQSKDFKNINKVLDIFGKNNPSINKIYLITDNGFKLGSYDKGIDVILPWEKESTIQYLYTKQASLKLILEKNDIVKESTEFTQNVSFVTFIIIIINYTLFILMRRSYRQSLELERSQVSLKRHHRAIEETPAIVIITDNFLNIEYVNKAFEVIVGYSKEDVLGKNISFLQCEHPDQFKVGQNEINSAVLQTWSGKILNYKKDGSIFWVSASISPVKDTIGNLCNFVLIQEDITEYKKVEDELSKYRENLEELINEKTASINAIVDTAVDAIITIDSQGAVLLFNHAAEKMFGYKNNEILGKNITIVMPEPHRTKHDQYLHNYIKTNKAKILGKSREVKGIRKNGDEFPILLSISKMEVGNKIRFTGILRDISAQKLAEEELIQARNNAESARQIAEESTRVKAAFLANMSHEIRTPMNAIIGFSELCLLDTSISPDITKNLKTIHNSAKSLLGIINDILDVSKLDSGKFALENVAFHLPNMLKELLNTLQHIASINTLLLTMEYHKEVPVRVNGDPTRLRQVLLNLVGNAIKFTHEGEVNIIVEMSETPGFLHFSIKDTGIGMSPEQIDKVFESFTQADGSTTRRFGGTGLGTNIAKQIIELMEGEIHIESEEGEGSTFSFTAHLPAYEGDEACLYEEELNLGDEYVSPRLFRILVAEDLEANATLVKLRLGTMGHTVHWVKNGREAVDAFEILPYDIVLMDVQMPEMDGLEATRGIRSIEEQSGGHIPILALTASVMREDHKLCYAAGMDGVVAKPIDFSKLFHEMEKVVAEGVGEQNCLLDEEKKQLSLIDFTPLAGLVDYELGLRTWGDAQAYAKALKSFADEHAGDVEKFKSLLDDHVQDARALAHALKGLAGNLAISTVASLTTELEKCLIQENFEKARAAIQALKQPLNEVTEAITGFKYEHAVEVLQSREYDIEAVKELFSQLSDALQELNPDVVEPLLDELASYLGEKELNTVRRKVDSFDFEAAGEALEQVYNKFEIYKAI